MSWHSALDTDIDEFQEDLPDPAALPTVNGVNILIRPVPVRKKTRSGLILADQTVDDVAYLCNAGRVVAMGPMAYDAHLKVLAQDAAARYDNDLERFFTKQIKFPEPFCKVGDIVVLPKHSGTKLKYKGIMYTLIEDKKVALRIEDAADIDPMFNTSGL